MRRVALARSVFAIVLVAVAVPLAGPAAAAGCPDWTDPSGDATTEQLEDPTGAVLVDSNLDIVKASLTTTAATITATITSQDLGTVSSDFGDEFHVEFEVAGKVIQLYADRGLERGPAKAPFGFGAGFWNDTDGESTAVAAAPVYDQETNTVTIVGTLAELSTSAGSDVAGQPLTKIVAQTFNYVEVPAAGGATVSQYDEAPAAAEATVTAGRNCAGPVRSVLTNAGATAVQYGDAAAVAAKLLDDGGQPLSGKTVTFTLGTVKRTAVTGADGVARTSLVPTVVAGAHRLVASFAGDDSATADSVSTPFTVRAETTRLTATFTKSGTSRVVTAKLTDDDPKVLAGQTITWLVNGKKVGTSKTSSAGLAKLTTAKAGQTVVAQYAGLAGKYAASKVSKRV